STRRGSARRFGSRRHRSRERRCSPTSRAAKPPRCTAIWPRRCSVARKRASMREGPLAELFRATEAAQRGERPTRDEPRRDDPPGPPPPPPPPAHPEPTPPQSAATEPQRAVTRWLEPIPDNPARLERAREGTAYLAVIRVVGVGGAGLNALDR